MNDETDWIICPRALSYECECSIKHIWYRRTTYDQKAHPSKYKIMTATTLDDEAALLARLQSQFGDINISTFLNSANIDAAAAAGEESDESSLEEPSPEELLKWQEEQFRKGKMKKEAKGVSTCEVDVHKEALQKHASTQEPASSTGLPDLGDESSAFFPASKSSPSLRALAAFDPDVLGTKWKRLYSSSHGDGLSFCNLIDRIRGYKGPTVLLMGGEPSASRCLSSNTSSMCANDDNVVDRSNVESSRVALGFFTIDYWTESKETFGSDDNCFLFSLDTTTNEVKIVKPKSRCSSNQPLSSRTATQTKYMYCLSSSGSTLKSKHATDFGICIGGTTGTTSPTQQPRLHITESFEECRCLPYDSLFEDADLLSGKCNSSLYYFDIDTVEVWGVGGNPWIEDALLAQQKERVARENALEKARKVDKRMLLEHFENGVLNTTGAYGGGLFGHQDFVDTTRDADCCI
jgi:hypothetical protein